MICRIFFVTLTTLLIHTTPVKSHHPLASQHITPTDLYEQVVRAWHVLGDLTEEWNHEYTKAKKMGSFSSLAPITSKAKIAVKEKLTELKGSEDIDGYPKIRASMLEYLQHDLNMYNDIEELGNLYSDPTYNTYFHTLLEKSAFENFKITAELAVQMDTFSKKAGIR